MKRRVEIDNVCIVNTVYSFFLYLLLVDESEYKKTFFFCSEKFPLEIRSKLNHYCFARLSSNIFVQIFMRIAINYLSYFCWPFLKTAKIYGGDNYYYSSGLIKNRSMILIEDGIWNYADHNKVIKFKYLRRLLFGKIVSQGAWGRSDNVEKIILTGIKEIPESIKYKSEIISIEELWNNSSIGKKTKILEYFNFSYDEIKYVSKFKILVLTQPLSEDLLMPEYDKLNLYRKLLCDVIGKEPILFKLHPRDKTDYRKYFSNIEIFDKPIPMEILSLFGIRFDKVYTIFSTAAKNLPYKSEVHFLGTSCHYNLLKTYGDIS